MIYGCAAWGFRETPLEQQLTVTRELGLSVLELGIAGHPNDFLRQTADAESIRRVRDWFDRAGIRLQCASTGNDFTHADAAACRASLEQVKKVIEVAALTGVKWLRIFAGFSPAAEVTGARWDLMITCLNAAIKHATEHGLRLGIETHGGVTTVPGGIRHFHSTSSQPELLLLMLEQLDKRAGIVFDPANLGAVGLNETAIINLFRRLRSRIVYLHLKDFRRLDAAALTPCACGEGQLNWAELNMALASFDGPGLIEYELPGDIVAGLQRSLHFLRG